MAARLTLVKAPSLQKLMVLFLLTFSGLGYPPKICEAVRCLSCAGQINGENEKCDPSSNPQDADCFNGCFILRVLNGGSGIFSKGCHEEDDQSYPEAGFRCMQGQVGQSGKPCLDTTVKEVNRVGQNCPIGRVKPGLSRDNAEARQHPQDHYKYQYCTCDKDDCNKGSDAGANLVNTGNSNGGSGSDGPSGGSSGGNALRINVVQVGITGLMIMRLATNFIF